MQALPARARLLAAVVVFTNLAGNALLSAGMKGAAGAVAFRHPLVLLGIALLVFWTVSRATLLSWADLSYVLPLTAVGYALSAIVGAVFLHEHVSLLRWTATLLIAAGVLLAGTTRPATARPPAVPERDRC